MAEAIGLASGLLALTEFTFQSSVALYQTLKSFKNHPSRVRELYEELEALTIVLKSLTDTADTTTDVNLSALELPLLRCGNACKDFEKELMLCLSRSGGNRTSFRDWAKLRYMGDTIDGFKQLLAGYKSTIVIALTDANLRSSSVTAEKLEEYRSMIQATTSDLEDRLDMIDEKLTAIVARTVAESDSDVVELRLIQEERQATQNCLQLCTQLSQHIDQIQPSLEQRSQGSQRGPDLIPELVMNSGLQECRENLAQTTTKLESYMQDLIDRLVIRSKTKLTSEEELVDLARLRDEWITTRHSLNICSKADSHLKENVSIIDNYANGDGTVQFLVSTSSKTIHGKNRAFGLQLRQFGGHMNDTSLQQISRDISSISRPEVVQDPSSSRISTPSAPHTGGNGPISEFSERYGPGVKLKSEVVPGTNVSPSNET